MGPVAGGVSHDLASWRWILRPELAPSGRGIAMAGLGQIPATGEITRETRSTGWGIMLLVIGVDPLHTVPRTAAFAKDMASLARNKG